MDLCRRFREGGDGNGLAHLGSGELGVSIRQEDPMSRCQERQHEGYRTRNRSDASVERQLPDGGHGPPSSPPNLPARDQDPQRNRQVEIGRAHV